MTQVNELIVSVSGIRGVIGQGLTPTVASAFAAGLGTYTGGGRIIVCRDGRPSGEMLRHAILAGLLSAGCEVHDIGIAPTPTCGLAVRRLNAAGGIQITASHNPAPWNGLKLFGPEGMVLTATEGKKVQTLFEQKAFRRAKWNELGSVTECMQAAAWHRDRVLELVDTSRIRSRKLRVFLDANGGAGGLLGRDLLEKMGCEVICQGCATDGRFLHEPEPIADNLREVCRLVGQSRVDLGLVLDPDADRLAIIDERGHYIGEELTLALATRFRLGQERGSVVINMSTSRVVEDIAKQHGCTCVRSAVGEANVAERMREVGAVIGGEGNGGVIDPRVGYVRDPFIGMGLILSLLAESNRPLSALVAELPVYHIVKDKYTVDRGRLPQLFHTIEKRWPDAKLNRVDGLRLDWQDRWVHVRPSNTEPIVRVIAEAPEEAEARTLCVTVGEMLKGG
jgi:phosphomannomutase